MARAITFNHSDFNFSASITKVDRKKVYGFSKIEVRDNNKKLCSLVSLNEDGTQILPSGSTGIAKFDSENNYIESNGIKAIDLEGNPAKIVPSVFEEDITLSKVESLSEYLGLQEIVVDTDETEEDDFDFGML